MTGDRGGRVALVTGAGSGIGRAVALALAPSCHRLVLVGRREPPLRDVAAVAGRGDVVAADLATEPGRDRAASAVAGRLDVLVCSAAMFLRGPLAGMSAADWGMLDAANVQAPMLLVGRCLPALVASAGDVVMINSTAGLNAAAAVGGYAASKHALRAATDTLRMELRGQGVRVLSLYPGRTDTPMQAGVLAAEGREAPPGSLMAPEDVAAMLCAALALPRRAEVTDITLRPLTPL